MAGQDFGINPQLGLSLHQMAGPEERATTRAKLEDLQAQVQERAGNAQKTQLANQQTQTKMGAEAAVRKMLQDKQTAGQDPTATDFLMLLGPSEGTVAAKAFNDSQKQAIDNHKAQLEEMQKSVDALANLANDMLSTKDPVIRAQKREQGITALHGVNGGVLDPKLADAFMKMGLTDSELQTSLSQSLPAMQNALAQQKQKVDEAKIKQENDFRLVDQKRQADELALNTRKQDFEEKKPVVVAPNATMATPAGAPIFTAPPAPPTVPQPTAPMSPERFQQEKDLKTQTEQAAATKAAEAAALKKTKNAALEDVDPGAINAALAAAEKHHAAYSDISNSAGAMKSFVDLARQGNREAYASIPLEGVLEIVTSAGVKRINMDELKQYSNAGSLVDWVKANFNKRLSGVSIPANILNDMEAVGNAVAKNSLNTFKKKIEGVNSIYGSKFDANTLAGEAAPATANTPIVQQNQTTKAYRYSTDGGKTWVNGKP